MTKRHIWVKIRKIQTVDVAVEIGESEDAMQAIESIRQKSTFDKNVLFESKNNPKTTFEYELNQ